MLVVAPQRQWASSILFGPLANHCSFLPRVALQQSVCSACCVSLAQPDDSDGRRPHLAESLLLAGFSDTTIWHPRRFPVPPTHPSLGSCWPFCKVLWSVDFNFKHNIYFDCGYLLWSGKVFFFFLHAFKSLSLNKPLSFGFRLLVCLRCCLYRDLNCKGETVLWQDSLVVETLGRFRSPAGSEDSTGSDPISPSLACCLKITMCLRAHRCFFYMAQQCLVFTDTGSQKGLLIS